MNSKHLGLEKDWQRRKRRLNLLPQYGTVELSIGGLFIAHDTTESSGHFTMSDNTIEAMKEMGIHD